MLQVSAVMYSSRTKLEKVSQMMVWVRETSKRSHDSRDWCLNGYGEEKKNPAAIFVSYISTCAFLFLIWWIHVLSQDAPSSEIRKAYRRLSLILHPDKNKDENAETQFRQVRSAHAHSNMLSVTFWVMACKKKKFPFHSSSLPSMKCLKMRKGEKGR